MGNTVKLSIRKSRKSPKYNAYGFNGTNTGWRFDMPWASLSVFNGGTNPTIRNGFTGLRFIYENNRKNKVRIMHNVMA